MSNNNPTPDLLNTFMPPIPNALKLSGDRYYFLITDEETEVM